MDRPRHTQLYRNGWIYSEQRISFGMVGSSECFEMVRRSVDSNLLVMIGY